MEETRLIVDGSEFLVRPKGLIPGCYDFELISGLPGYGFSYSTSAERALSKSELEAVARDFMANAETGGRRD